MHTILSRLSQGTTQLTTAVSVLAIALTIIGWVQLQLAGVSSLPAQANNVGLRMSIRNTRRAGSVGGKPKENMRISFDLDADLTPLFNWNTKQVFVYLTAEYSGARDDISNSVSFWDRIITTSDKAILNLKGERGKYNVWDFYDSFEGRNASLTLRWDVQPHIGLLVQGSAPINNGDRFLVFPTEEHGKPAKPAA